MPDEFRRVAGKAQHAAALLQRYNRVQNEPEKEATVAALNDLFPHIRCRHHRKTGLTVFFLADKLGRVPTSLRHMASTILSVRADGQAEVVKSRHGVKGGHASGTLIPAMDLLVELGGTVPAASRKSRWELIGSDEDWLE